jgi:hypothetical protein
LRTDMRSSQDSLWLSAIIHRPWEEGIRAGMKCIAAGVLL